MKYSVVKKLKTILAQSVEVPADFLYNKKGGDIMSKILIADDEPKILKLVGDFLKKSGYETVETDNSDDAYRLYHENPSVF